MLWLLGNVLHLIRSCDFNTYPRHNVRINNNLRIDAWLELMIGVGWLAFPGQISALLVVYTFSRECLVFSWFLDLKHTQQTLSFSLTVLTVD